MNDNLDFELVNPGAHKTVIKVIGIGGGGGNAVYHMAVSDLKDVAFIAANTDAQVLQRFSELGDAVTQLQLGSELTGGKGAGMEPGHGRQACLESMELVEMMLDGADMVFLAAGMGGGTGTGGIPLIAEKAHEQDILTVAVVTTPFDFEKEDRMRIAQDGIAQLKEHVDSLIIIANQRLMEMEIGKKMTVRKAFAKVDDVLLNAVRGISEIITRPGVINLDFADVRTVMSKMVGTAVIGSGTARGEHRVEEAMRAAVANPLHGDLNIAGAERMLVNVTGGDLTIDEQDTIGKLIDEYAGDKVSVIYGIVEDDGMSDQARVTVIAGGIIKEPEDSQQPGNESENSATTAREPLRAVPQMAIGYGNLDTPPGQRAQLIDIQSAQNVAGHGTSASPAMPNAVGQASPKLTAPSTRTVRPARTLHARDRTRPPTHVENQSDLSGFLKNQAD